jgi:hypothetical protein
MTPKPQRVGSGEHEARQALVSATITDVVFSTHPWEGDTLLLELDDGQAVVLRAVDDRIRFALYRDRNAYQ